MQSVKKYWKDCFKWNNKLSRKDFWVGLIITMVVFTAILAIIQALDPTESIRFPSVIIVIFVFIVGLWTALIRRLLDAGYPRALVLVGFIPCVNMVLWVFAALPKKISCSEEELDAQMGSLLDQMEAGEKAAFADRYTAASTPYLKYNCIKRQKDLIGKSKKVSKE